MVIPFHKKYSSETKKLVLSVLKEFGYDYDPKLDFDLEHIEKYYSVSNREILLISLLKETVAGVIAIKRKDNNTCEFRRLYVMKEERRKGIGKELFEKAIEYAKKFEYKKIILETTSTMPSAIHFYEKNGFARTGQKGEIVYYARKIENSV